MKGSNKYLKATEVHRGASDPFPVEADTGKEVVEEWEKMSKSKYNGVDPNGVLEK